MGLLNLYVYAIINLRRIILQLNNKLNIKQHMRPDLVSVYLFVYLQHSVLHNLFQR